MRFGALLFENRTVSTLYDNSLFLLCIDFVANGADWYKNSLHTGAARLHDTIGFIDVHDLGEIFVFRDMKEVVGVRI